MEKFMTVIFASRDTLIVDNVGTNEGVGVYTNKLNTFGGPYPGIEGKNLFWCVVGSPFTGAAIFHHGLKQLALKEAENDTHVFVFDADNLVTYRISWVSGDTPQASILDVPNVSLWGDGGTPFVMAGSLLDAGVLHENDLMRAFHTLWLKDSERLGHDPRYIGWCQGEPIGTSYVEMSTDVAMKLWMDCVTMDRGGPCIAPKIT
jgi:hypothetical protein